MQAALLLLSCSPTEPSPQSHTLSTPRVTWSEVVPTVAWLSADGTEGAEIYAIYGEQGAPLDKRTQTASGDIAILGLAASGRYEARLVATWHDGTTLESDSVPLEVPDAPIDLPKLDVSLSVPGNEMENGYLVAAVSGYIDDSEGSSFIAIYNGLGEPVWWRALPEGHVAVSPSLSALPSALVWDDYDWASPGLPGSAVRASLDGEQSETMPVFLGHHVVRELEAGTFAWMARDPRPWPEGNPVAFVTADAILQGELSQPDTTRPVVTFYDALYGGQYAPPCEHPAPPLPLAGYSPLFEWSHGNSLVWLQGSDRLLAHLRWVDTIALIDRDSGEITDILSGPLSDYTIPDGSPPWSAAEDSVLSHAHLSEAWEGGLVAFDNGNHRDPPVSSIVELAWDEGARTIEEVYRWEHPDQYEVNILGDVKKLPSGNYLAAWSTMAEITLSSPAGELLWQAHTSGGEIPIRILWLSSLDTPGSGGSGTLSR